MLQLQNKTPFAANMLVLPDEEGVDSLYVNVKASFRIGAQWTLMEEQAPPQAEDIYWGEPAASSLRYASDFHTGKPSTDVVMLGQACAAEQASVSQLDVTLSVDALSKTIRVFGDRTWQDGSISRPLPFKTMPMVYEQAYGGRVHADNNPENEIIAAEERNPVGCGFRGGREESEMDGVALPNLEDPRHLIRTVDDNPEPACFGFRAPNWRPRVDFAGTYDEQWMKERAPYLPPDYDSRFLNAGHPDLVCNGYLQGGEAVQIINMHPKGKLRFSVPYIKLASRVDVAGTTEAADFNLETLLLEPNRLQASLVWKAKIRCDKKVQKINEVSIALSR